MEVTNGRFRDRNVSANRESINRGNDTEDYIAKTSSAENQVWVYGGYH